MTDLATVSYNDRQLTDAVTQIRGVLQDYDPTLDLSAGGPIDSLLVHANGALIATSNALADTLLLQTQLKAIAEGDVEVSDVEVDRLMEAYRTVRKQETTAGGYVTLFFNTGTLSIERGTIFALPDGREFYAPVRFVGVANAPVNTEDSTTVFVKIDAAYDVSSGATFRMSIFVYAVQPGPGYAVAGGSALRIPVGYANVLRVEAATNFVDGTLRETNAELVSRALSGVTGRIAVGAEATGFLAADAYPGAKIALVGANNQLMTRDRQNVFGISTGGKVDVYVKSGAVGTAVKRYIARVIDVGARRLEVIFPVTENSGAYRSVLEPYYQTTPPVIVSGGVIVESAVLEPAEAHGYTPDVSQPIDLAFSASAQVRFTFTDTRQTSDGYFTNITNVGQEIENRYVVRWSYMPGVSEAAARIYSDMYRPAGTDVLVKAAVPCITTMSCGVVVPADYTGDSEPVLAAKLADSINKLDIGTGTLNALVIAGLLREIAPQLLLQSVVLSGVILGQAGADVAVSMAAGKLTIPTNTAEKFGPENTFFVTDTSKVTVTFA